MRSLFKIIITSVIVIAVTLCFTTPIFGNPNGPAPKATGGVGYNAGGLQRYAEFNAFELSSVCSAEWNLDGNWELAFNSTYWHGGNPYLHDMVVSGGTATGGWPAGGSYMNSWTATVSISVDYVIIHAIYSSGSGVYPYEFTATGTIASNGNISGSWTDTLGDSGSWSNTSGAATRTVIGCNAKGMFHYTDANGNWYYVNVQYVDVVGTDAYFAGPVTSASQAGWVGNWLSAAVHDGGEPAYLVDSIWGVFTNMSNAVLNVATNVKPDGEFAITSGNLQVHTYE